MQILNWIEQRDGNALLKSRDAVWKELDMADQGGYFLPFSTKITIFFKFLFF